MTIESQAARLSKLETLFCEQEYTIETLNTIVTQQNNDIKLLATQYEMIKDQIKELKKLIPEETVVDEKPPHY